MPEKTFQVLCKLAIKWETQARYLYTHYAKLFKHEPKVAAFWIQFAKDETGHIAMLKDILKKMPAEKLLKEVSNKQWKAVIRVEGLIHEASSSTIQTLDDAYEMAHQLEMSEVNTIFTLLAVECLPEEEGHEFISAHIKEHVHRLMEFEKEYTKPQRKHINIRAT